MLNGNPVVTENSSAHTEQPLINMKYLNDMMNNNKNLIRDILDLFLQQVPDELTRINTAIEQRNFSTIKSLSHSMRSSFSVLDVLTLTPILQEMEELSSKGIDLPRIQVLYATLQIITHRAIAEVRIHRINYD